jgi:hypothetical protein
MKVVLERKLVHYNKLSAEDISGPTKLDISKLKAPFEA